MPLKRNSIHVGKVYLYISIKIVPALCSEHLSFISLFFQRNDQSQKNCIKERKRIMKKGRKELFGCAQNIRSRLSHVDVRKSFIVLGTIEFYRFFIERKKNRSIEKEAKKTKQHTRIHRCKSKNRAWIQAYHFMLYVAVCHVDRLIECKRRHHISIVLLIDFHDSWFIQPYIHCIKMWSFIFVQESSSSFTLSFIRSFIFISVAEGEKESEKESINRIQNGSRYRINSNTDSNYVIMDIYGNSHSLCSAWNKQTNKRKKNPHQIPNKQTNKKHGII